MIQGLEQYAHQVSDPWRWRAAAGPDCQDIVDLALVEFGKETDTIFQNDTIEYSRNLMLAIVSQFYNPTKELVSVAYQGDVLLAYTWAMRGQYSPWSTEEMVAVRIAHCRQDLPARERVALVAQMIQMWEVWARACKVNIICSTSVRKDQKAFIHLHERAGYDIRGSVCYKRLSTVTMDPTTGVIQFK